MSIGKCHYASRGMLPDNLRSGSRVLAVSDLGACPQNLYKALTFFTASNMAGAAKLRALKERTASQSPQEVKRREVYELLCGTDAVEGAVPSSGAIKELRM